MYPLGSGQVLGEHNQNGTLPFCRMSPNGRSTGLVRPGKTDAQRSPEMCRLNLPSARQRLGRPV
eukprot:2064222-Pyramimonas_sp.AAC.1